jgi:hypothetical protein
VPPALSALHGGSAAFSASLRKVVILPPHTESSASVMCGAARDKTSHSANALRASANSCYLR